MARKARIKSTTGIYHVLVRAASDIPLFSDSEDTDYYVSLLQDLIDRGLCRVYAYSLHPTHIHLLIKEGQKEESVNRSSSNPLIEPIGDVMRRLSSSFSYYFNVKHDHFGPVHQDRFKSQPVETRAFFLKVLDFILTQPLDTPFKGSLFSEIPSFPSEMESVNRLSSNPLIESGHESIIEYEARTRRVTDFQLLRFLQRTHSFTDITEFRSRPSDDQLKAISDCKHLGGSVRQLVRLTGISYLLAFQAK